MENWDWDGCPGHLACRAISPAAEQAGYVLVDKLVTLIDQMANSPDVSYDQINSAISEMMVMAKEAKAEQRVDQQSFDRYSRILRLIKLVIIEDKAEILRPIPARNARLSQYSKQDLGEAVMQTLSRGAAPHRTEAGLEKEAVHGLDDKLQKLSSTKAVWCAFMQISR